jgi:hypothetical protein
MTLESQVCSLELAKKLKELGLKQNSYYFWKTYPDSVINNGEPYLVAYNSRYMTSKGRIEGSAFTVAELGEMLPAPAGNYMGRKRFKCGWEEDGWYVELLAGPTSGGTNTFKGQTTTKQKVLSSIPEQYRKKFAPKSDMPRKHCTNWFRTVPLLPKGSL